MAWALWANAAVLAVVAVTLLGRGRGAGGLPAANAAEQGPIAGGAGVFVMPAQLQASAWGCYLLDVDRQSLCVYQYYPGDRALRLVAARNYRFDRDLKDYNTFPPPREIERLVQIQNNSRGVGVPDGGANGPNGGNGAGRPTPPVGPDNRTGDGVAAPGQIPISVPSNPPNDK